MYIEQNPKYTDKHFNMFKYFTKNKKSLKYSVSLNLNQKHSSRIDNTGGFFQIEFALLLDNYTLKKRLNVSNEFRKYVLIQYCTLNSTGMSSRYLSLRKAP